MTMCPAKICNILKHWTRKGGARFTYSWMKKPVCITHYLSILRLLLGLFSALKYLLQTHIFIRKSGWTCFTPFFMSGIQDLPYYLQSLFFWKDRTNFMCDFCDNILDRQDMHEFTLQKALSQWSWLILPRI